MIHLLEFPCESQLCTWMEFSFVYACVCFDFVEHLLLNGTHPVESWLCGSPRFFVNLNEEGRGGRGKPPQFGIPSCSSICQRG